MTRRRRLALGGIATATAALLATVVLIAGFGGRGVAPAAQGRLGPVLLITGYGGGTGELDVLAAALRAAGRQAVIVPPVGDGTGDLRDQARQVDRVAQEQISAGAPSVDVVGYSAGGVVARIWVASMGGAGMARRVVTLASPHHGTDLASFGTLMGSPACALACRQLSQRSELLADLPETPKGPRWISLWSRHDDVVTPQTSARLSGALNIALQDVCANDAVRHGNLPSDPLVVGLIKAALAVAPLERAPGRADCARLRAAARP